MTLAEVARVVGAPAPSGVATVTGSVVADSRLVGPGDLFVALPGARSDGHDHVATAAAAGAVAAIVRRPVAGTTCLQVPDPLAALQALAAYVFAVDQPLTFGITGSSGKTTAKDLLAQVLALAGPTLAPVGSFNNELGLPLTALRRTAQTRFAALEYSARGPGHIAFLAGLVRPHVSVVLNVGSAHLGEFGDVAAIARAKGELVEALPPGGVAVLNADDPLVLAMAQRAPSGADVVSYGQSAQADVRAAQVRLEATGRASFLLQAPDGEAPVSLQVVGEHQVSNALAVAAAVLSAPARSAAALDLPAVATALSAAIAVSPWRMAVTERPDGVTVINDAYNANPDSMRAALRTLAVMGAGKTRRTVAVLGPMAELGDGTRDAHMDLGRFAVRLDIGQLVVVGADAGGIHAGAVLEGSWGSESIHVDDLDAAETLLNDELAPGDVVLVKASRSAGLERLAARLLGQPG